MDAVPYYDSQVEYQKRVGEIEKERFKLEREMFSMMKSDERLQNLRAAKLRSYWQQICDGEKSARERNDELLRDFKELEVKLAGMETQTKKLKGMKLNYEEKVKKMYVKWHQDVEMARAKKQLHDKKLSRLPTSPISSTPKRSHQISPLSANDSRLMQPPPAAFADKNSFKSKQFSKPMTESSPQDVEEIASAITKSATPREGNVADDITDSFSVSEENLHQNSLNRSIGTQQVVPVHQGIGSTATVAVHANKQYYQDASEQRHSRSNPSSIGSDAITDVAKRTMSPEPRPDSKVSSDSFASDLSENFASVSRRQINKNSGSQNQELKASTAYQAMLKQYSGMHQVEDESEDDDFEEIFSGDGTEKSAGRSDDKVARKSENNVNMKDAEPVRIPTDTSARFPTPSKKKPASNRLHKADWDTDSDEPEDGYLSNTGGSSKWDQKLRQYDDDDDFFD